jgi:hypothetical protein
MVIYRTVDALTGIIACAMVMFGPWAFGTTQAWSIWTMNVAGYALGMLWLLKRGTAWFQGLHSTGWRQIERDVASGRPGQHDVTKGATAVLSVLTLLLLLYCLTSAINARATFRPQSGTFEYYDCLRWLPHSFDRRSTWFAFWTYLGLACSFWSIRDWLLGESARLLRLLTVLTFNGGLVAAECILQRLMNSPKLLFVVRPELHQTAMTQLGPYAYRANGAEYLNLVWPVCLGFWWTMLSKREHARLRHSMLISTGLTASAVLMSASRGGVFVCISLLFITVFYLQMRVPYLPAQMKEARFIKRYAAVLFIVPLLGLGLGWLELKPRTTGTSESMERRERIYEVARRMANDFGVFGSGPGTYESVSEMYRPETPGFWPAQVHNDWLETRVTFGLVGSALVWLLVALVGLSWLRTGAQHSGTEFIFLSGLALAGCLAHARFDFPFQVHSIVFLFVLICAILSAVSCRPGICSLLGHAQISETRSTAFTNSVSNSAKLD